MADDKGQAAGAAAVDDEEEELARGPGAGSAEELLDAGAHAPIDAMRHSTAHVMAEAVLDLFPGAKLGIGPAIADGFYYDFDLPRPLTPADLEAIEGRMRESVAADHAFVRKEMPLDDGRALEEARASRTRWRSSTTSRARRRRRGRPMPPDELLRARARSSTCARVRTSPSTGQIGPFKLLGVAGAYWRGDEKRPMLQRIYGTVWQTQEELDAYLFRREEAKKRDHRRLGVQLDLFSFHDVSPGSAFWHPKGQRIWRTLEAAMRELQERRGYQEVSTPIVVTEPCGAVRALGPLQREHVHGRVGRPDVQPQADELPRVDVHLPLEAALVPRPAAALQRVRPAASQRADRHAGRADAGPPVHPGRCAHLRAPRPVDR